MQELDVPRYDLLGIYVLTAYMRPKIASSGASLSHTLVVSATPLPQLVAPRFAPAVSVPTRQFASAAPTEHDLSYLSGCCDVHRFSYVAVSIRAER